MKQKLRVFLTLLLCAVASVGWGQTTVTDVLNQTFTGVTGTSYASWSDKKGTSGAVYKGLSAGDHSSIQLRSNNNNSGVVTTTSGGKVKSITVEWESNTMTGRTLNIYGKTSAYSAASDLYNNNNQGTLLGTIVYGTSTELAITGDYTYIGFRSASGSMYLKTVNIVWETGGSSTETVASPTFDPVGGLYTSARNVTISTTTEDATIHYTTDGTDPTTSSSVYSSPITISSTTTIKAMAVKDGMDNSAVASATYTIVNIEHAGTAEDPYTVADALNYIETLGDETSEEVYVAGIISELGEFSSQYHNYTYNISDDGTTSNQLVVFRGKYLNGADFTSADQILLQDEVIICGQLVNYNGTKEFTTNSKIISQKHAGKNPAEISYATTSFAVAPGEVFTAPTLNNPHNLTISYSSNNEEVATVDANSGVVTLTGVEGTAIITASSAETDDYEAGSASYSITVRSVASLVTVDEDGNVIFNLSDNGWGFPTSKQEAEGSYSNSGYTIKVAGSTGNGFYFDESAKNLLIGKSGAYLTLPAFTFNVGKIEVFGAEGGSGNVTQNIYVGDEPVSTQTTSAKVNHTYDIASNYQEAGTIYTLKVTNANNTRVSKIIVYKVDERAEANIAFSPTELTISAGEEFTQPIFSNPNNLTVTFEGTNDAVAMWDETENELVLKGATGTTVITASFAGNNSYQAGTATLTVTVEEATTIIPVTEGCGIYQKVASANELEAGKRYLIVYENEGTAYIYNGKSGTNNYASKVDGTVTNNRIDNTSSNAVPVVLQTASTDTWFIMDGSTFLYWSSGNSLYWSESASQAGNTWTINFEGNTMSISNVNTPARYLQYNTSSPRFACYTGTQKDVVLFKELMEAPQPESVDVTIAAAATDGTVNFGTLYYGNMNLAVPEGVKAYTASVSDGQITLSEVQGAIPAGTGVVLKTTSKLTENTSFTFTEATEAGTVAEGNMLLGTDEATTTTAPGTGSYKFYALSLNGSNAENSIGFYFRKGCPDGEAFTNGAHKAYLAVPVAQAKGMSGFAFNDAVTAISGVAFNAETNNVVVYNLAGQRVNKAQKGIYIVNGKKVVIR